MQYYKKYRKEDLKTMKRSDFAMFPSWSAEYVVAHAKWRQSRGKRPSTVYRGIRNPIKALALATAMSQDKEFKDVVIVEVNEDSFTKVDGWIFGIQKEWNIKPKVGDIARFYGRGIGYIVRGLDINGRQCYYRTKEQQNAKDAKSNADWIAEQKASFEKNKIKLDEKYQKLFKVFQQRIDRFRANNPDFRWKYESYEIFCCEQAMIIVKAVEERLKRAALKKCLNTRRFIKFLPNIKLLILNKLNNLPYEKQKQAIPEISDDHSGNTFGCSMTLAALYLSDCPHNIVRLHGALSPLVGSEEYGD